MKKTSSDKPSPTTRVRVRRPDLQAGFAERLSKMIGESGLTLKQLAQEFGGFRIDTLSKLASGGAKQIQVDLMAGISYWAYTHGVSLAWLLTGFGGMRDLPAASLAAIEQAGAMNNAIAFSLLLALARRMGIDVADLAEKWRVNMALPQGVAEVPLRGLFDLIDRAYSGGEAKKRC